MVVLNEASENQAYSLACVLVGSIRDYPVFAQCSRRKGDRLACCYIGRVMGDMSRSEYSVGVFSVLRILPRGAYLAGEAPIMEACASRDQYRVLASHLDDDCIVDVCY